MRAHILFLERVDFFAKIKVMAKNYAFIDSQNLNLGVRNSGWRLDYRKFRLYLKNKFNVEQAFLFIGMVPSNQHLYTALQKAGYILIFKQTIRYLVNGKETVKGNVDAELVLYAAAIEFENYDKAIIVSGDGDFACLIDFLMDKNKLAKILVPNTRFSSLLRKFNKGNYILSISLQKDSLKFNYKGKKRRGIRGRSKP